MSAVSFQIKNAKVCYCVVEGESAQGALGLEYLPSSARIRSCPNFKITSNTHCMTRFVWLLICIWVILTKAGCGNSCSVEFRGRRLKFGKGGWLASVQLDSCSLRAASSALPPITRLLLAQRPSVHSFIRDRTCCSSGLMSLRKGIAYQRTKKDRFKGQEGLLESHSFFQWVSGNKLLVIWFQSCDK